MVRQIDIFRSRRIYIDANVLINYCTGQTDDCRELNKLFSPKCDAELVISNLSIVQVIAKLQTKNRNREAFDSDEIKKFVNFFYTHCKVYEVKNKDINDAMNLPQTKDMEDNIHYVVSARTECDVILTNNTKDFVHFDIPIRSPKKTKSRKK